MAAFLGRDPGDIVFTSGGTESANLALLGPAESARRDRGEAVLLSSAVEHPAVRESARAAAHAGLDTRELPVDPHGLVDPDALARTLCPHVTSVAVMTANNETGVIQPLRDLIETIHRRAPDAVVFTDAVQAAPWIDLAEATAGADLVSVERAQGRRAGRRGRRWPSPVGLRSNPASTAAGRSASGAVAPRTWRGPSGWRRRCGWWRPSAPRLRARVAALRDRLRDGLLDAIDGAHRTVPAGPDVLPGHLHLCIPGVEREELLVALGEEGVCVSGGSSCASGALQSSHVLAAMGVAPELAARRTPVHAGLRHDGGRRRPRPGRRPRRGGVVASEGLSPGGTLGHAGARGHVGRRRLLRGGGTPGGAGP